MSSAPPPLPPQAYAPPVPQGPTRECPQCKMAVPAKAKVCPFCRKKLGTSAAAWGCLMLIGLLVLGGIFAPKSDTPSSSAPAAAPPPPVRPNETREEAQKRRADLKKTIATLQASFTTKKDEVDGSTLYIPKGTTQFVNTRSELIPFFSVEKDGSVGPLVIKNQFVSDDWLFIKRYVFSIDGQPAITIEPGKVERDNGALGNGESGIWEWSTRAATAEDIALIKVMEPAKKVILRYEGQQYRKDRTIGPDERKRLSKAVDLWTAMRAAAAP